MTELAKRKWFSEKELKQTYGKYWKRVMYHLLEEKPGRLKGQQHRWAFKGDAITPEEYRKKLDAQCTGSVGGAIDEAKGMIEEIKSELEEWASNMPEQFENKRSEIEDAVSQLEDVESAVENISLPEEASDRQFVCYPFDYPVFRGRPNTSRPQRARHISYLLECAKDELENFAQEMADQIGVIEEVAAEPDMSATPDANTDVVHELDDVEDLESLVSEVESAVSELDEAISTIDGVDFPRAR